MQYICFSYFLSVRFADFPPDGPVFYFRSRSSLAAGSHFPPLYVRHNLPIHELVPLFASAELRHFEHPFFPI
jgi:hypothetical protein